MTKTPGPARGLLTAGIALADTKPMQAPTDPAGESISRRACGAGSRSTLIVPRRAGNRGHRDPLEGRGVSPGQNRGRDTWGNSGFHNRVNATAADSRAGVKSFGLPPAALGPVPSANLPGEEPDALVCARPALRGGELGNDSPYSAPGRLAHCGRSFYIKAVRLWSGNDDHSTQHTTIKQRCQEIGTNVYSACPKTDKSYTDQ